MRVQIKYECHSIEIKIDLNDKIDKAKNIPIKSFMWQIDIVIVKNSFGKICLVQAIPSLTCYWKGRLIYFLLWNLTNWFFWIFKSNNSIHSFTYHSFNLDKFRNVDKLNIGNDSHALDNCKLWYLIITKINILTGRRDTR